MDLVSAVLNCPVVKEISVVFAAFYVAVFSCRPKFVHPHLHCFNGHLAGKPGLASCRLDPQCPMIIIMLSILAAQATILHTFLVTEIYTTYLI